MLIWQGQGWQVIQHEYLSIFYVQKWMLGDNPRSYTQHYDYFTVYSCNDVEKVKSYLREQGVK